ncbi:MAG: hypothetical protein FWF84_03220 [Kiritimatiellaeota bacterium]|nr:hypothetical protein [Kiritimatiellota bacterium]
MNDKETLRSRLLWAWEHPDAGGVYYSANGAETASERLNAMPCWDHTPYRSHYVDYPMSTAIFPWMFGCEKVTTSTGTPWLKPCLHTTRDFQALKPPRLDEGIPGELLEAMRRQAATLPEHELIRCMDVQSPLGILELMGGEAFYTMLIEAPEAIHAALRVITDFQCAFLSQMQRVLHGRYNPCGFPLVYQEGDGIMVADDTMSLVSPAMHREFSVTYLNQLAERVGPLYYHSCSWSEPYFENILAIRNVKGYNWNPGDSVDAAIITRAFAGKGILSLHLCAGMHRDKGALRWGRPFADEYDFFKYIVESAPPTATFYFWLSDICRRKEPLEKIYDFLHNA